MNAVPTTTGFLPDLRNPCWEAATPSPGSNVTLKCLPYFQLIGGMESGIKGLYYALAKHPEVLHSDYQDPSPHFWCEAPKTTEAYINNFAPDAAQLRSRGSQLVMGDASASTLATYMAHNGRCNRVWINSTWDVCSPKCITDGTPDKSPGYMRCMAQCWQHAAEKHWEAAEPTGLPRLQLATPLLMRAAYGNRPPKLVALLREPVDRMHSGFWKHGHYRQKYGEDSDAFLEYAREMTSVFDNCTAAARARAPGTPTYAANEEEAVRVCALFFEGSGLPYEFTFFHADQLLRGLYWPYMELWTRYFKLNDHLLILPSETWFERPREVMDKVVAHLGLSRVNESLWADMSIAARRHRPSYAHAGGAQREVHPEAAELLSKWFEPHNKRLGLLLTGVAKSPWANISSALAAASAAAGAAAAADEAADDAAAGASASAAQA